LAEVVPAGAVVVGAGPPVVVFAAPVVVFAAPVVVFEAPVVAGGAPVVAGGGPVVAGGGPVVAGGAPVLPVVLPVDPVVELAKRFPFESKHHRAKGGPPPCGLIQPMGAVVVVQLRVQLEFKQVFVVTIWVVALQVVIRKAVCSSLGTQTPCIAASPMIAGPAHPGCPYHAW